MGRGPSVKTELKKLKKKLETEAKVKWKLVQKKPFFVSMRQRLEKVIDNAKPDEIAKFVAIMGMTIMVKKVIDTTEELREQVKELIIVGPQFFPAYKVAQELGLAAPTPKPAEGFFPEWADWLISFTLAYIIVEHFGQIMQATGNILSSVKTLVTGLLMGGGTG